MATLESYPGFLNVVLFECSPDHVLDVAQGSRGRIDELHRTRVLDRATVWMREQCPAAPRPDDDHNAGYYRPRVYTTTGTFDVAAIFLSPKMELSPWTKPEALRRTGQDIHMCLLPKGGCCCGDGDDDFNGDFWDAYSKPASVEHAPEQMPEDQTFVGILKLKLNPSVVWPVEKTLPSAALGCFCGVLEPLGERINAWRRSTEVGSQRRPPLVGLGLDFGWSEIMVVAHADDPSKLLALLTYLRQQSSPSSFVENKTSHLVATSITTIGADYHLRRVAQECWNSIGADGGRVPARALIEKATGSFGGPSATTKGAVPGAYLQIGCDSYPGHEKLLIELFEDLADALVGDGLLPKDDPRRGWDDGFEVGKRDLWAPALVLQEGLGPRAAWVLHALIQLWARRSGRPESADGRLLSCFDFHTRFGAPRSSATAMHLTEVPGTHIDEYPGKHVLSGMLRLTQLLSDQLIPRLCSSMAAIQIPYALAEQVLNLANTFYWAWNREVLWDESVEMLPVILTLTSNLENHAKWWRMAQASSFPAQLDPFQTDGVTIPVFRARELVQRQLAELFDVELPRVLQAFRASFYNRHLASYLTDGLPDANLRFRGSVQQLLSVANMIVDAFASVVLGWRGSMAIIGDTTSPQVQNPCDVLLVKLNLGSFSAPLLLESIGHEIGHHFIRELDRTTAENGGIGTHQATRPPALPLANREALAQLERAFRELSEDIFLGDLCGEPAGKENQAFVESTADLIELLLFRYESIEDWVSSFMLRMVLGSRPTTRPSTTKEGDPFEVPYLDEDVIRTALLRAVLVRIALELTTGVVLPDAQALAEFRQTLRARCTLGPSLFIRYQLQSDVAWKKFLDEEVFSLPWLGDIEAVAIAHSFYSALREYLAWEPDPTANGGERYLAEIRSIFGRLRGAFLPTLLPALHIRHWMGPEQRELVRGGSSPAGKSYWERPWRVTPEPTAATEEIDLARAGHQEIEVDYRSLIFQRSAILARSNEVQEVWSKAHTQFFLETMALVPLWRATTLRKIAAIEDERSGGIRSDTY